MKESHLISVKLAKAFLVIMALMLLVFIVSYATKGEAKPEYGNEFTSPYSPITTRSKIIAISISGFILAIPFSCALNAIALYINRDVVKLGWLLQTSLIIALIGFIAVPVILYFDHNIEQHLFIIVAAVPVVMWLISCIYFFRLDSKEKKIIPDD